MGSENFLACSLQPVPREFFHGGTRALASRSCRALKPVTGQSFTAGIRHDRHELPSQDGFRHCTRQRMVRRLTGGL